MSFKHKTLATPELKWWTLWNLASLPLQNPWDPTVFFPSTGSVQNCFVLRPELLYPGMNMIVFTPSVVVDFCCSATLCWFWTWLATENLGINDCEIFIFTAHNLFLSCVFASFFSGWRDWYLFLLLFHSHSPELNSIDDLSKKKTNNLSKNPPWNASNSWRSFTRRAPVRRGKLIKLS